MNAIERFVRGTLGCQCPDDAFRSISLEHLRSGADAIPYTRLLVGNRLLVYVIEASTNRVAGGALIDLVARGRQERNERGYNRFRLVVASDEPESAGAARLAFESEAGTDEKAHIHVVPRTALPPGIAPLP